MYILFHYRQHISPRYLYKTEAPDDSAEGSDKSVAGAKERLQKFKDSMKTDNVQRAPEVTTEDTPEEKAIKEDLKVSDETVAKNANTLVNDFLKYSNMLDGQGNIIKVDPETMNSFIEERNKVKNVKGNFSEHFWLESYMAQKQQDKYQALFSYFTETSEHGLGSKLKGTRKWVHSWRLRLGALELLARSQLNRHNPEELSKSLGLSFGLSKLIGNESVLHGSLRIVNQVAVGVMNTMAKTVGRTESFQKLLSGKVLHEFAYTDALTGKEMKIPVEVVNGKELAERIMTEKEPIWPFFDALSNLLDAIDKVAVLEEETEAYTQKYATEASRIALRNEARNIKVAQTNKQYIDPEVEAQIAEAMGTIGEGGNAPDQGARIAREKILVDNPKIGETLETVKAFIRGLIPGGQ
ncbi:hypothetical protein H6771_00115 [Candidatus Peribacteria bacterium]|nr:hypothetical protein [Candidatus Peribacteria bacterium]